MFDVISAHHCLHMKEQASVLEESVAKSVIGDCHDYIKALQTD